MKRYLRMMVAVFAVIMTVSALCTMPVQAKTKHMGFRTKSGIKSITLKWKKRKVDYYKIYKKKVTKTVEKEDSRLPVQKEYKYVKKLRGSSTTFRDKKVKKNNYYAYIIKGYTKKDGKKKLKYTTYIDGDMDYEFCGLVKPNIGNAGYGEFDRNTPNKLYLYAQSDCGMEPAGYVFYRRVKGQKDFKKVTMKVKNGVYKDSNVKPGKTYQYRAKAYKKVNGKKRYSKYSAIEEIPAVNLIAKYSIETVGALTGSSVTVKITSNKNNGETLFYAKPGEDDYFCYKSGGKDVNAGVKIVQYSTDNKTYKDVPSGGVSLKPSKTVYLKLALTADEGAGSPDKADSLLFMDTSVKYNGSGVGYESIFSADFSKKTATCYEEFD